MDAGDGIAGAWHVLRAGTVDALQRADDCIHVEKSVRAVRGRAPQGTGRPAGESQGAGDRRSLGSGTLRVLHGRRTRRRRSRQPWAWRLQCRGECCRRRSRMFSQSVCRGLEDLESRQETGGARLHCSIYADTGGCGRGHASGGRKEGTGPPAQPDCNRHAPAE